MLIIEDEWLIACEIAAMAERAGGTSVSMAATQIDAIAEARAEPPDVVLSDVQLREGTGPLAVEAIIAEHGQIPVIFITGTPEHCKPCEPPHVILGKPLEERIFTKAFRERAPCNSGTNTGA